MKVEFLTTFGDFCEYFQLSAAASFSLSAQ